MRIQKEGLGPSECVAKNFSPPAAVRIFVVGGGEIYLQALEHSACRTLHITRIEDEFDCDTQFPDPSGAFHISEESEVFEEKGIRFKFTRWTRNA